MIQMQKRGAGLRASRFNSSRKSWDTSIARQADKAESNEGMARAVLRLLPHGLGLLEKTQ